VLLGWSFVRTIGCGVSINHLEAVFANITVRARAKDGDESACSPSCKLHGMELPKSRWRAVYAGAQMARGVRVQFFRESSAWQPGDNVSFDRSRVKRPPRQPKRLTVE